MPRSIEMAPSRSAEIAGAPPGPSQRRWNPRAVGLAAFALVVALLPFLPVPAYWITKLNYIGLFALVALGLVLLTGIGGLTSFGQAAFAGIGAYTSAYLATKVGLSPWVGLAAGLALTAVVALV